MEGYEDTGTHCDSTTGMGMPSSMSFLRPLTVHRIVQW